MSSLIFFPPPKSKDKIFSPICFYPKTLSMLSAFLYPEVVKTSIREKGMDKE